MSKTIEHAHYTVTIADDAKLVEMIRSSEPFRSVGEMIEVLEALLADFEGVNTQEYGLFVDGRAGPQRDAQGFRDAFAAFRTRLEKLFARVGVVIHSSGPPSAPGHVRFFQDEALARAWARGEG